MRRTESILEKKDKTRISQEIQWTLINKNANMCTATVSRGFLTPYFMKTLYNSYTLFSDFLQPLFPAPVALFLWLNV